MHRPIEGLNKTPCFLKVDRSQVPLIDTRKKDTHLHLPYLVSTCHTEGLRMVNELMFSLRKLEHQRRGSEIICYFTRCFFENEFRPTLLKGDEAGVGTGIVDLAFVSATGNPVDWTFDQQLTYLVSRTTLSLNCRRQAVPGASVV